MNNRIIDRRTQNSNGQQRRIRRRSREREPEVVLQLDRRMELSALDLSNPKTLESLTNRCQEHAGEATVEFRDLLALTDQVRYGLFAAINALPGRRQIVLQVGCGQTVTDNLLDAVLSTIEATESTARLVRARQAAIEAASLEHPDAPDIACSRLVQRLREAGVTGVLPQSLAKQVRVLAGESASEAVTAESAAYKVVQYLGDDSEDERSLSLRFYEDEFYLYQDGKWKPTKESELRAIVARVLQDIGHGDRVTTRFVTDVMTNLKGMALLKSVSCAPPLWVDEEDAAPSKSPFLAFANGLVNLEKAVADVPRLLPHDRRHFSTVALPYDFDADAECPLWQQTLQEIFPRVRLRGRLRDNRIAVLQEFIGYLLLTGNMSFEKFLVLCGNGANGKSTISNVIVQLCGDDNVAHVPLDRMDGEFRLWQMQGKLANVVADMNRLDRIEEGLLKNLVSGDPIQINRKNLPLVTMYPTAKLIFGTNHLPQISDRTDGMWRRMIVMPFRQRFDGRSQDRRRVERLTNELPGIFNWAIVGAQRLCRNDRFSRCAVCDKALADHRLHSDPIAQFLEECTESLPDATVRTTSLYQCFRFWCEDNGRRAMSHSEFGKYLHERAGVRKDREGGGVRSYVYRGLRLSPNGALLISQRRPRTS